MYETLRIVEKLKPKYVIWENVKNLLGKKHIHNFENYIKEMNDLGYNSYYKVLNSKDYGVPQSRDRVFTISIRKDIDKGNFNFPEKQELKIKLKDLLENIVDEKYYLTERAIKGGFETHYNQNKIEKRIMNGKEVHPTICARFTGAPTLVELPGSYGRSFGSKGKLQDTENVSDTLLASMGTGGGNVPIVLDEGCTEQIGLYDHTSSDNFANGKRDYGFREEYGTLKCTPKYSIYKSSDYRIRKLTPKECFRLMSFTDEEFERARKVNSDSQLYKQARKLNSC
jgi:DNA (cytosine-5)-methyltransferase 1